MGVIRRIRNCSITIMTKDELGDISGGGQCTENGTWWWNQRIKKATKAEKDAFMSGNLADWNKFINCIKSKSRNPKHATRSQGKEVTLSKN